MAMNVAPMRTTGAEVASNQDAETKSEFGPGILTRRSSFRGADLAFTMNQTIYATFQSRSLHESEAERGSVGGGPAAKNT